jgi:hypothetical protein
MGNSKKTEKKSTLKDDALSPAAKSFGTEIAPLGAEVGQALTVTVQTLLRPVFGAVWGANKIFDFVQEKIEKRTAQIPHERLIEPDLRIVGPAFEAVRYAANDENIQELFAAIIANSMDSQSSNKIHPSFIEIIKQINSLDTNIIIKASYHNQIPCIKFTAKGEDGYIPLSGTIPSPLFIDIAPSEDLFKSIENIVRLKIFNEDFAGRLADEKSYEFASDTLIRAPYESMIYSSEQKLDFNKGFLEVTLFGKSFASAVT